MKIEKVKFTLNRVYDTSDKTYSYYYAVSGSFSKELDVDLHHILSNLLMPKTFGEIKQILYDQYNKHGYQIKDINGKGVDGYVYYDKEDGVGNSEFVIEYISIGNAEL